MGNKNKVVWVWACLQFLLIPPVMAQETLPGSKSMGPAEEFKLTVEPAWVTLGQPNITRKSELEKIFFPDQNSTVEFFFNDSLRYCHGFRIDAISTNNYIMEVVWVTDFKEEYPIERIKIPVSLTFVGQLWETYYYIMRGYLSRGIAPASHDGYSVTFRCVVEDFSVWTFFVRNPLSHIKDLTTTCNEIVKEVQGNGKMINEEKHIKQLDSILRDGLRGGARIPGMELKLDPDSQQLIIFGK